jgi:autotransporter-associated beta strand protein
LGPGARAILAIFAVLTVLLCQHAHATVDTWSVATTGTWDTPADWSTGVVPTGSVDAGFGNGATTETITVSATDAAMGLIISDTGAITLSGGTLTLGTDGILINAGSGAFDTAPGQNITILGSQSWTNNSSSTSVMSTSTNVGAITSGSGITATLTFTGTGTGGYNAKTEFENPTGGGALTVAVDLSAANFTTQATAGTYTGGTQIECGTLTDQTTLAALGSGTISLGGTAGSIVGNAELYVNGNSNSASNAITTLAGGGTTTIYTNGSGNTYTFTGPVTLGSTLIMNGDNGTLQVYSGSITGTSGISVQGSGCTFTLSGSNNYTGTTAATNGTLNLTGTLNGSNVSISNVATFNESSAGSILGSGVTFSASAGTSTLSGSNNYTGATTVTGGTVEFGNEVSLYGDNTANWTAPNIIVGTGATLTFAVGGSGEFTASDINTVAALGTGTSGFESGATLGLDTTAGNFTYGNAITNPNSGGNALALKKVGSNMLTLTGSDSYTGATTVSAGTLQLGGTDALGNGTHNTSGVTVSTGATLDLDGFTQTATAALTLNGAGVGGAGALINTGAAATYGGAVTLASATTIGGSGNITLSSPVSGSFGLTYAGTGTLTLSGGSPESFTGPLTVNGGTVSLINDFSNTPTLAMGGGTFNDSRNAGGFQSFGATDINAGASVINDNNGSSNYIKLGTESRSVGGTVDFTINTDTIQWGGATNSNGILGGWATYGGGANWAEETSSNIGAYTGYTVYSTASSTFVPGSTANVDFQIGNTTAALTQTINSLRFNTAAADTLTLGSSQILTIASGGILVTPTAAGNVSTITGGTLEGASGADLIVNQWDTTAGGSLTIGSIIANNGAATAFTKSGAGLVTLGGTNTYTGATYLNAGTLTVTGLLGATGTYAGAIADSGTFIYNGSAAQTLSGNISGLGSVTQEGTGSALTLSASNSFTGGLAIQSGTVIASTSAYALGAGGVTLGNTTGSNPATLLIGTTGLTYANAITLATNSNAPTLTIGNFGAAISTTFTGGVTGANNLTINENATTGNITFATTALNNSGTITNIGLGSGATTITSNIGSNVTGVTENSTYSSLFLSGANTFGGTGVTILAGNVVASTSASALGAAGVTLGNSAGGSSNASLFVGTTGLTFANAISLATTTTGTLTIGNTGTAISSTFTGGVTGTNNLTINDNSSTGTIAFTTTALNNTGTITNIGVGTGTTTISGGIGSNVTGLTENSLTSGLTLTGAASSYTGATTISTGTLTLDFSQAGSPTTNLSSTSSALVMGGGAGPAALNVIGLSGTINSQAFNGATFNPGASSLTISNNATSNPTLVALGAITRNVGGTVNFTQPVNGAVGSTNGYTTTTANDAGGILGGWATVSGTGWAVNNGTNIVALASYYTTSTGGNTAASYSGSNVDVTSSQTLSGAATVNSLRFNTAAADTLTLTGVNVVTSGGILETANVGANASTITSGTLEGASGADLVINQYNTNAAGILTINSVIANNGSATGLTLTGSGTVVLGAQNTYTGTTYVNGGTLQLGPSANNTGITYTYGALSIASGATATEYTSGGAAGSATLLIGSLSGSGTFNYLNSSTGVAAVDINETSSSTFSGTISPTNLTVGNFVIFYKFGSGTLNLNGPAGDLDIQRGIVVDAGALTLSGSASLALPKTDSTGGRNNLVANQGAAINLDNSVTNVNSRLGNVADDGIALNGGSFNLIGSGTTTTIETDNGHAGTAPSTSYGLGLFAGSDLVSVTAGTNQSAVLTITNGGLTRGAGASALFQGTNLGALSGTGPNVANIIIGGGTVPVNSATGTAGSGVTLGILVGDIVDSIISGSNTYGIATYDTTNGIRRLNAGVENTGALTTNANVDATTALTNSTVTINSLQLDTGGSIDNTTGTLTDASGTILTTGSITSIGIGGGSTLEAGATGTNELIIYNAPSTSLTIGAAITTTGGLTVGGAGSTILTANNASLSGTTTINGGILSISAANNLGTGPSIAINNGGELQSTGASVTLTQAITIGGTNTNVISGGDIDVSGASSNTLSLSGGIAGVGSLTKSGVGILSVSNTNTYTGATTVTGGTLLVSGSLSGTTAASVANGATLEVDGLLNLSATNFVSGTLQGSGSVGSITATGGNIDPGLTAANSASATGTMTASGALTLSSTTNFSIRLGMTAATDHDELKFATTSTAINLAGANLELTLGSAYVQQATNFIYVLINGDAANDITGTFSEGLTITENSTTFNILYNENAAGNGVGDDVDLQVSAAAIPEPSTWAVVLAGAGMLIGLGRRRRRFSR